MSKKVITNIDKRWEKGIEHHSESTELYKFIEETDFKNGDTFGFKSGGDGDNGEQLMYILDIWFENKEQEEIARSKEYVFNLIR